MKKNNDDTPTTFLNWFYQQREPQFKILDNETVDTWGDKIADQARKGAALGKDCGKMCKDCAFNNNQPHTIDYLESVDGAVLMLVSEGRFNCHTPDGGDAHKPCAGFLYAKEHLNSIE
jgi:hypothetical protein